MNRFTIPCALLVAAGCSPQSAVLTKGEYWAFMSNTTSFSIQNEDIKPGDWGKEKNWAIDCRLFEDRKEEDLLRIPDVYEVCQCHSEIDFADYEPNTSDPLPCRRGKDDNTTDVGWPPFYENWMSDTGYFIMTEQLDPWRGEAVMTGEGDLQVSFHHRLPGGEDFRFSFVIDPQFAPKQCVTEGDKVVEEPIDGDWVEHWTEDLKNLDVDNDGDGFTELEGDCDDVDALTNPKGRGPACHSFELFEKFARSNSAKLYYLTGRAFQFNPGDLDETWSFKNEWRSGFGSGKFAAENFHVRAPRYGEPVLWEFAEADFGVNNDPDFLWYCNYDCLRPDEVIITDDMEDPPTKAELQTEFDNCVLDWNDCMDVHVEEASAAAAGAGMEWAQVLVGVENENGVMEPVYQPLVEDNSWRQPDISRAGLDGWTGYHPSYVAIDGKVEVGGSITGAFQLVYDADESNSRWLVKGQFEVDRIRKDHWTTVDLRAEKHEENGTKRCNL